MQAENKAVLYLRVSTDDKGQNPERQKDLLESWCKDQGVQLLGIFTDVGTSATKTNPFERPVFLEALRVAQLERAAILVEKHDRFTRQGSHEYGWAITELKRNEVPVDLWIASKGSIEDQSREMVGALTDAIEAEAGAKWSRDHSSRVASGMKTASKAGKHVGRPPKKLSEQEYELARILSADGKGVRYIASIINKGRGLYDRSDIQHAIRKHGVSKSLVHEYLTGKRQVGA